jgi:ketosteroid isomerase-like protein
MRIRRSLLAFASAGLIFARAIFLMAAQSSVAQIRTAQISPAQTGAAQAPASTTEIPIHRCDRLPVVILQVDKEDKRFLVDTAATSFLNAKSFIGGRAKAVQIHSWNQTTALNVSNVFIGELALGSHIIRNVELPAIDLSAISKACGGRLDGILGVDLLERLEVTIDLERSVARLGVVVPRNSSENSSELSLIFEMQKAIQSCSAAFNNADAEALTSCFDPEFALSSPRGELHGVDQAMNYFQQYFGTSPHARLSMTMSDQRAVGELVWALYDYAIETPSKHTSGRGMMICRKSENHWHILSMHESPFVAAVISRP